MQKFHLLFVESDDHINFLTHQIIALDDLPIHARYEKNPLVALNDLAHCPIHQFPDAIIVGMNLSFMTGLEFAEAYFEKFYASHLDTQVYLTAHQLSLQTIKGDLLPACVSALLAQPFSRKTFLDSIIPNIHVAVV